MLRYARGDGLILCRPALAIAPAAAVLVALGPITATVPITMTVIINANDGADGRDDDAGALDRVAAAINAALPPRAAAITREGRGGGGKASCRGNRGEDDFITHMCLRVCARRLGMKGRSAGLREKRMRGNYPLGGF